MNTHPPERRSSEAASALPSDTDQASPDDNAQRAAASAPNAADPSHTAHAYDAGDPQDVGPGADLEPDEAADMLETPREATRTKDTRSDQRDDDDLISLDTPD